VNWHFQWGVQRKGFAPNACVMINYEPLILH